jgi:dihydrofolate synthase/folylpolyglutamate synthase
VDYPEALAYISATGRFGIKLGLERTRALLDALGRPDAGMRGVLVAGTNGKGSVCAHTSAVLQQARYRVGLMPKPHLQSYTERICIDGRPISEADFAALISELAPMVADVAKEHGHPTEFEMLTAAAIKYLRDQQIDLLVCEVGMGGRLDSTNVLDLGVKVITPVNLDHQQYLGPDIESIAREKAGIIRAGDDVVIAALHAAATEVVEQTCASVGARRLVRLGSHAAVKVNQAGWEGSDFDMTASGRVLRGLHTPLLGAHQARNAALAVLALQVMARRHRLDLTDDQIRTGLAGTRWPGRLEVAGSAPRVLIDSGHNTAAIASVVEAIRSLIPAQDEQHDATVVVLFGVMHDKDWREMLRAVPKTWDAVYTAVDDERALPPGLLLAEAQRLDREGDEAVVGSAAALKRARQRAGNDGLVVALGSLYLAGEVRDAMGL